MCANNGLHWTRRWGAKPILLVDNSNSPVGSLGRASHHAHMKRKRSGLRGFENYGIGAQLFSLLHKVSMLFAFLAPITLGREFLDDLVPSAGGCASLENVNASFRRTLYPVVRLQGRTAD